MLGQSADFLLARSQIPDDLMEFFEPAECGQCYLCTMVGVFREIRRVLRRDGTCWVNMGDSYSSGARTTQCDPSVAILGKVTARPGAADGGALRAPAGVGKPKDLLLMPARLALALQADGWWVRSDIIWHKPNPMPESVTDRPTSAHEHVFLLTKSARYFYDADAVREAHNDVNRPDGFKGRDGIGRPYENQGWAGSETSVTKHRDYNLAGRSCRNVWTIATSPFSAAHFATFPPELAERCIKAGTSERGACSACGKPWVRTTETPTIPREMRNRDDDTKMAFHSRQLGGGQKLQDWRDANPATTTGWSRGCQCGTTETRPCVVLDPFAGAGTTLLVADRLQRDAIGIELNTAYTEMALERCRADAPLFTSFPPAEPPEDERMADLFTDMAAD